MRPIFFEVDGIYAWYIWDNGLKGILEGDGCGPFLSIDSCYDAIRDIKRHNRSTI